MVRPTASTGAVIAELGARLPSNIRTVILFPSTGQRIWKAIETHSRNTTLPESFFVQTMEDAVKIAYARTEAARSTDAAVRRSPAG